MDAVYHFRGNVHRRVEAERHVCAINVVVNGFGQANDIQPLFAQQIGRLVRAVAAQAQKAVQPGVAVGFLHGGHLIDIVALYHLHHFEGGALGAQNGAAHCEDAGKFVLLHLAPFALDKAVIAVLDAHNLHFAAKALIQRLCRAADGGVQPGAIAAGCKDTHAFHHCFLLSVLCPRAPRFAAYTPWVPPSTTPSPFTTPRAVLSKIFISSAKLMCFA